MPRPTRLLAAAGIVLAGGLAAAVPATLAAPSQHTGSQVAADEFMCLDLSNLNLSSVCIHPLGRYLGGS